MVSLLPSEQVALKVCVHEKSDRPKRGYLSCVIGEDIVFNTQNLETYCCADWNPLIYDTLLVAAAIEFCDRVKKRPSSGMGRHFDLSISVHDPMKWNSQEVQSALLNTVGFLTGDVWNIRFVPRKVAELPIRQNSLPLPNKIKAVIPFSDGMDSRAVYKILEAGDYKNCLVRIRLGSKSSDLYHKGDRQAFTSVPYKLPSSQRFVETSARSRGFKFQILAGLVAYLTSAEEVIVPESGQGALGPVLITVGQNYEDYRSHPLFMDRMERLIFELFGHRVKYKFPRLWRTKAETLSEYVSMFGHLADWQNTISCWQQSRQVSVEGRKRQCGVCAACMLRRVSVHAANLKEDSSSYVWEDLSGSYESGAAKGFPKDKMTPAMNEYAIAGVLHMDHLAALSRPGAHDKAIEKHSYKLSISQGITAQQSEERLKRLLTQHSLEWSNFVQDLGDKSYISRWACVR